MLLPYLSANQRTCHPAACPEDFREVAKQWADEILGTEDNNSEERELFIKDREELLFYRVDEIRARAKLINQSIKPDLVICIHLNAAPWADPEQKELVERNDHHMLVNGCYMGGELAYDDQRFEMIWRLLNRWSLTEQHLAESLSLSFSEITSMPTFFYKGPNALKVGRFLEFGHAIFWRIEFTAAQWSFLEPYVANSLAVYPKIQDWISGQPQGSLVDEYADAVMLGLKNYLTSKKRRKLFGQRIFNHRDNRIFKLFHCLGLTNHFQKDRSLSSFDNGTKQRMSWFGSFGSKGGSAQKSSSCPDIGDLYFINDIFSDFIFLKVFEIA